MKSQVLILKVLFDDEDFEPKNWNWSEIIGCGKNCIEIMNHGAVEDVDGSFSQEGSKK